MNASNILKLEEKESPKENFAFVTPKTIFKETEGASFNKKPQTEEVELDVKDNVEKIVEQEEDKTLEKAKILSSFFSVNEPNYFSSSFNENNSNLTSALHTSLKEVDLKHEQTKLFDDIEDDSSLILIGKVFQTYLLIEKEGSMFVIDQHAAHERLLYDKLTEKINEKQITSQGLLVPHIVTVNHLEQAFLVENLNLIKNLGFELEEFGGLSFKVSSVPSVLNGMNVDLFFNEILKDMNALNKTKTSELITDYLKQASCKAAVKAGNNLSKFEISTLLNKMKQNNMTLLCPHGRPVVVQVTRKEMDKWFKRIL